MVSTPLQREQRAAETPGTTVLMSPLSVRGEGSAKAGSGADSPLAPVRGCSSAGGGWEGQTVTFREIKEGSLTS